MKLAALVIEPLGDLGGVLDQRALAFEIAAELFDMALELGDSLLGALFVGLKRLTRHDQTMQRRAGLRLLVAQRRQLMRGDGLEFRRLGLLQRPVLHAAPPGVELLDRRLQLLGGELIGDKRGERLILADLRRKSAVTRRLARLALQAVGLAVDLFQHVFEAGEVFRRRVETQLGLVAARMQAGDAGGVFKNAAARLGLGGNDLADLSLAHQRRRARAGGGVGEQNLHVACAHLAAVDPIGRALLALDSARDLDRIRRR